MCFIGTEPKVIAPTMPIDFRTQLIANINQTSKRLLRFVTQSLHVYFALVKFSFIVSVEISQSPHTLSAPPAPKVHRYMCRFLLLSYDCTSELWARAGYSRVCLNK